ncbi:MAG: HNH endonuclease [Kiloniellales bacterium]
MAHGVFIHRSDSIYDDVPSERYQFPRQYLARAEACVGDWVIYYEPRKVTDTRGYFAVAKVQEVIPDPGVPDFFLAIIEEGSYLDFGKPVPFRGPHGVVERGVLNDDGRISGRAQAAVRCISADDFNRIVELGLMSEDLILPRFDDLSSATGFQEAPEPFQFEQHRDRSDYMVSRVVRDRNFRLVVLRAYDERCAMTGLRLINGGGRAEVEAAHIRPVEENGPDLLSNGIALSGTAHWLFDRGLISIADDLRILVSRQVNDLDGVHSLMNRDGYLNPPKRIADRPHPCFLDWHREHRFKH